MRAILRLVKRILLRLIPTRLKVNYYASKVGEYTELSSGEIDFFNLIMDDVESVVDVGARTDTFYSNSSLNSGVKRRVYMFEANPSFAKKLNSITPFLGEINFVYNVAIGKEIGELYYYYDTQSFVEQSNVGTISKYRSKNPIKVRTIDSFADTIPKIDFLKTDIEEMDFYALLGAAQTLPRIHFLQFELGLGMPFLNRRVINSDYWELLEPNFSLYVLRDESNPIWRGIPQFPLLLTLSSEVKLVIEILQTLGYGFNIVGINKHMTTPVSLHKHIGEFKLSTLHSQ